jgi:hypothetical protein
MFGIVPVLFSANIGMLESVDGVVLGLSETVAGLRWYIDLVDRGVRGLDTGTGMSVVVESVVFLFFFGGAIMASLHKILKRKWQLNGTERLLIVALSQYHLNIQLLWRK